MLHRGSTRTWRYPSIGLMLSAWGVCGCIVQSACYHDADCPTNRQCVFAPGATRGTCEAICKTAEECDGDKMCDAATGLCVEPDCRNDDACADGFSCKKGRCVAPAPLTCPSGMAPIAQTFCIDRYEASRPDADDEGAGKDTRYATSRPGVIPWRVSNNQEAEAACAAAGKSLCTEAEWEQACIGPDKTAYAYGETYDPTICNGIDTFCSCDVGACVDADPCPFPYCYDQCGANFHPVPTGQFSDCTNGFGVFDMNGNLWEHVLHGDETRIRGGAYNCLDSKLLHRCDYIPGTWAPSAQGFRCCAPGTIAVDGGVEPGDAK